MAKKNIGETVDPVTLSGVWNGFMGIINACGDRVMYSAQSQLMGQIRDLGPAILTTEGNIVCAGDSLPTHFLASEIPTKHILEEFGKLDPGDMVLANDGHIIQSGHLMDWTHLIPFYWHDELVFYGHFRGHVLDSGGAYTGGYFPGTYDCYGEGLNIPPVKIFKKGKINEEVRKVIFNNIRTPAAVWSDLELVRSSLLRVQDDVCNLIDRYGLDTIRACVDEMIRRDEMATRMQIKEIPDGVYYGESAVDWDGTTPDKQVFVRVNLTVKGDEMTFDFSDSDDQVEFINSPLGTTHACTFIAILLVLDSSIPHNHGVRVPIHIVAPEGKVVNPTRPHTYSGCGCSCGTQIVEAVMHALAKATPDRAMGDWSRHFAANVAGRIPTIDPRSGRPREYYEAPFVEEGGTGAVKGFDGWDGMVGVCGGAQNKRGSVELEELKHPIRFDIIRLLENSEGAGEFIGSRGTYGERVCTAPPGSRTTLQTGDIAGDTWPCFGVAGAPQVPLNRLKLLRDGKKEKEDLKAIDLYEIGENDILYTECYGGGGWGDPLNRDPEKVKFNAMEGLVTFDRAKNVYGVVLSQTDKDNPETIDIDYDATRELRKQKKKESVMN